VAAWEQFPWLRHGFSTRLGGVSSVYLPPDTGDQARPGGDGLGELNLGWTADDLREHVIENRRRFVAGVCGSEERPRLITVRQTHSAVSLLIPQDGGAEDLVRADGRAAREADGLISSIPGLLLGVQTADCVPVLVADTVARVVAAFHAGWRGTAARIVEQGVLRLRREFGSRPENLVAAIGPSIGPCCYTVGAAVRDAFRCSFDYGEALFLPAPAAGRAAGPAADGGLERLDLWEANRRQLVAAGVAVGRITTIGECAACTGRPGSGRYFSHRADHGFTGRMMSAIGIAGPGDPP